MRKPIESLIRQKLSLFFGAFGLSLLLWVFVVSENEYTLILDLPIEARNLNVQKAHQYMENNKNIGKLLLKF